MLLKVPSSYLTILRIHNSTIDARELLDIWRGLTSEVLQFSSPEPIKVLAMAEALLSLLLPHFAPPQWERQSASQSTLEGIPTIY